MKSFIPIPVVLALAGAAQLARADGTAGEQAAAPTSTAAEPELKFEVVKRGEGRDVKPGDTVLAHLVVQVKGGRVLVDTRQEGDPQALPLGTGNLVPALEKTIARMRQGDRFKVEAPWQLGYGETGYPELVPAKSDLVLDVEIVGFLEIRTEVLKSGEGKTPVLGEPVLLHYVGTLADGKAFESTRDKDAPHLVTVGSGRLIQGFELTLRKMRVGDRLKVTIPWQLAFGGRGLAPSIPPRAEVVFDVERLPLPEIQTEVIAQGKGPLVVPGQVVSVHYVEMLPDGTKIGSSRDRGKPYQLLLGSRKVIVGWELALARMRVGDRRRVRIPSVLAYGAQGREPDVPPKTDLVYDMEVVDAR